jgi:hypothetical protein
VWTPKRILLLALGFGVFCTLFIVYSVFLGGIDGIMPLPQEYWPSDIIVTIPEGGPRENEAVKKLKVAFGPDSMEVRERTIKLTIPTRGMVLATNEVKILDDGRVRIVPFSVALFGKDKGDGAFPEINTVQADEAYLTLDRPITNQFEMNNRKIIGGELRTNILIVNNRATAQRNDDIEILIGKGTVYYEEKRHLIWTPDFVQLKDNSSKPEPTLIRAKGMEVQLVQEAKETKEAKKELDKEKAKGQLLGGGDAVSGVERVVLQSDVDMHLWVDAGGFLGSSGTKEDSAPPAPSPKPAAEPEKAHVVIRTYGPFVYHAQKDLATFDSPEPNPANAAAAAPSVTKDRSKFGDDRLVNVVRERRDGESVYKEELLCDHLELQFRPKPRPKVLGERKAVSTADKSGEREIETALATARPGNEILLTLDQQSVEAYGNKLHYTAAKGKEGSRTVLSGSPLEAWKEGHKITATELVLISANESKEGQGAEARGPGEIYLFDRAKNAGENQYPCHARWKDTLYLTKDKIGERTYDLLTLNTDAAFVDDEHKQELAGQRLQVWLEPAGSAPTPSAQDAKNAGVLSGQRPYKVEAQGEVRVDSPELRIPNCQTFIVIFQDAPPPLPDALPPPAGVESGVPQRVLKPAMPVIETPNAAKPAPLTGPADVPVPLANGQAPAGNAPDTKAKATEAPRPIELGARTVRAIVRRVSGKNELQTVFSEGAVKVHQEGSGPKDKGVNISGEMLQLDHDASGDKLQVFGDGRGKVAELQLGEMILIGPKVVIDQRDNTANVEGVGTMDMPSNASLEGDKKQVKEGTRLTINWNQSMFFDGRVAVYQGGVVAHQTEPGSKDKSRLQCLGLQVTLDRDVSLKEGQKAGEAAKVDKLVCDREVNVVSIIFDPKGKMTQFRRLENCEMRVDHQQDSVNASGPGRVTILQYGAPDTFAAPQQGKKGVAAPKQPDVLKLTRVLFRKSMFSTQKNGARTTHFYENVRVLHLPTDDPEVQVDENRLPKNSFTMTCGVLEVVSREGDTQNAGQFMKASVNVTFQTPEFYGVSDSLVYNEKTETILFKGTVGSPARVYQARAPGAAPKEISGQQLLYHRRTGEFEVVGGNRLKS